MLYIDRILGRRGDWKGGKGVGGGEKPGREGREGLEAGGKRGRRDKAWKVLECAISPNCTSIDLWGGRGRLGREEKAWEAGSGSGWKEGQAWKAGEGVGGATRLEGARMYSLVELYINPSLGRARAAWKAAKNVGGGGRLGSRSSVQVGQSVHLSSTKPYQN